MQAESAKREAAMQDYRRRSNTLLAQPPPGTEENQASTRFDELSLEELEAVLHRQSLALEQLRAENKRLKTIGNLP